MDDDDVETAVVVVGEDVRVRHRDGVFSALRVHVVVVDVVHHGRRPRCVVVVGG